MQRTWRQFQAQPWATYLFLLIQVLVYLLMTLAGGSESGYVLAHFGAKVNDLIAAGQWWRLLTPMFLHIGLTHLVINSVTIYFIGNQIEMLFGHWRFILLYLLSGFSGNLASFVFNTNLSAGSSTAIFGLFGAFFMLVTEFRENTALRAVGQQFGLFILLNLVFDVMMPGVDLAGHVGGLLGGFLGATVVGIPNMRLSAVKRIAAALIFIIAAGAFLWLGLNPR